MQNRCPLQLFNEITSRYTLSRYFEFIPKRCTDGEMSGSILQVLPAVHRGFLERSRRVPVERLLSQAQKQNKRLLLCGHVRLLDPCLLKSSITCHNMHPAPFGLHHATLSFLDVLSLL